MLEHTLVRYAVYRCTCVLYLGGIYWQIGSLKWVGWAKDSIVRKTESGRLRSLRSVAAALGRYDAATGMLARLGTDMTIWCRVLPVASHVTITDLHVHTRRTSIPTLPSLHLCRTVLLLSLVATMFRPCSRPYRL